MQGRLWPILQTAIAATVAWYLAVLLLPDGRPSFASIAAVICLGASYGQRGSKSLQLVGGVVLGICVASAIVALIGTGSLQIGLMVVLAMTAAVLLRGGELLTAEAAVSAILLVSLDPSTSDVSFTLNRVFEALIGGSVALAVSALVFPPNPALHVGRAAQAVFAGLGGALERLATALERGDTELAREALAEARGLDSTVQEFNDTLDDRARHGAALAAAQAGADRARPLRRELHRGRLRDPRHARARAALGAAAARERAGPGDAAGRGPRARRRGLDAGERLRPARARRRGPLALVARGVARRRGPTEVLAQIRSTAVDLRRAADLTRDPGVARPEAPTEELLATV